MMRPQPEFIVFELLRAAPVNDIQRFIEGYARKHLPRAQTEIALSFGLPPRIVIVTTNDSDITATILTDLIPLNDDTDKPSTFILMRCNAVYAFEVVATLELQLALKGAFPKAERRNGPKKPQTPREERELDLARQYLKDKREKGITQEEYVRDYLEKHPESKLSTRQLRRYLRKWEDRGWLGS